MQVCLLDLTLTLSMMGLFRAAYGWERGRGSWQTLLCFILLMYYFEYLVSSVVQYILRSFLYIFEQSKGAEAINFLKNNL